MTERPAAGTRATRVRWSRSALVGLVAGLSAGVASVSANPGPTGALRLCVHKSTGAVRVISKPCSAKERTVTVNQQGEVGPTGPTGVTGPTGPTGVSGAKGDRGEKGDKGDRGFQGLLGPQGATGSKGDRGPTGNDGLQGDEGPAGPAGPQGDTGLTGPIGLTGPRGDQGPEGIPGSEGPIGPAGPPGGVGERGDTGDTGPEGPTGRPGFDAPLSPTAGASFALTPGLLYLVAWRVEPGSEFPTQTGSCRLLATYSSGARVVVGGLAFPAGLLRDELAATGLFTAPASAVEFGSFCSTASGSVTALVAELVVLPVNY